MLPTFNLPGDTFPVNIFGEPARGKWIHTVGSVAKVTFISNGNHPYTGGFTGGTGILRLSSALDPGKDNAKVIPAASLKMLRNGMKSGNIFFNGVGRSAGNTNYFSNTFSNHIGTGK